MKKILIFLFLTTLPFFANAQTLNANFIFQYASEMRAVKGNPNVVYKLLNLADLNDHNGGEYMWDSTAVAADDGYLTIRATNIVKGAYLKILNSNSFTVHVSISGISGKTQYPVSFGRTLPVVPNQVLVTLTSPSFISTPGVISKTTTGCTLNFAGILSGTYEFDITIYKSGN